MAAKYQQIARVLFQRIDDGTYPQGSMMPAIEELAAHPDFAVNPRTMRAAYRELENQGLIVVKAGVGTLVRNSTAVEVSMDARQDGGWAARPWAQQHPTDGQDNVVQALWTVADPEIAARLGIEVGSRVVYREREQFKGGAIAQYQQQWIPGAFADDIKAKTGADIGDLNNVPATDMFTLLEQGGHKPWWTTEQNSPRMPHAEEQRRLELPPGVPVLDVQRVTVTQDGTPVETSVFTCAGDRVRTSYTVKL